MAALFVLEERNVEVVAGRFKVTPQAVRKAIEKARKDGILRETLFLSTDGPSLNELLPWLKLERKAKAVRRALGEGALATVRVFPDPFYAEEAAKYIRDVLDPPNIIESGRRSDRDRREVVCGIAYGSTLYAIAEALSRECLRHPRKPPASPPIIFPVRGEPFITVSGASPSALARQFAELLGSKELHTLEGIPAVVPFEATKEAACEWQKHFSSVPSFAKIFGEEAASQSLIEKATTLITSVGPSQPVNPWTALCTKYTNPNDEERAELVGDIAGVPIARTAAAQVKLARLEAQWIGLRSRHIKDIAGQEINQPEDRYRQGVIVCCRWDGQKDASEALVRLCKAHKWCNHLLLDATMADKVLAFCRAKR